MQSTFSKQVAYNQRILEAERDIAGFNCDVPHFLEDMTLEEPGYVCINSSEEMDRDEQATAGQLWIQGNRHKAISNTVLKGMANTRDSALLYAAAEAVTWNHASQPDEGRKGQRVVIFPKELVQLEAFLATSDPSVDPEDGHPLAYEAILRESAKYETPPLFVKEDSDFVANDLILSANMPEWLAISRQVATGGRRRVLEDGNDVMSSSDEDDPLMKPDKERKMYTPGMDPKAGPIHLSSVQAMTQRFIGKAIRAAGFPEPPKSVRLSTHAQTFPSMAEADEAITRSRAVISSASPASGLKAVSSPGERADNPTLGQQVPNYPIVPYSGDGSRAGSFRPRGGSGSTDTRVDLFHPSKT
jgi:hypothetical protein